MKRKSTYPALVIHGGAWDIPDDAVDAHYRGIQKALKVGWAILKKGGSSVDAVEESIIILENDSTFDAGRGSFLNSLGEIELDASIMNGKTFRAGAVAAVKNIQNPISLSRLIMEKSEHILLTGLGANRFAKEHKVPFCKMEDLLLDRELQRWLKLQKEPDYSTKDAFRMKQRKLPSGTVGAVAMDKAGVICAGTSTGGTPNKYPGRVGDSPLIGCGTYADSSVGGVSTTGWGEAMIKVVMAKTVIDIMEQNGGDPEDAAKKGITILDKKAAGFGGVIVLNKKGHIGIAYNTPRMARAYITSAMKNPVIEVE
ncbi:MAG: isoaspartyl peptidase/L-asparaginase [Ignavibacteriales bacterium]|nr:isoaspartyl peptidase/L-asparaginase [Ignavibacteriales bacterium]